MTWFRNNCFFVADIKAQATKLKIGKLNCLRPKNFVRDYGPRC